MEMDSYEIIRFKYVRKRQKKPFFIYARLRELGRQDKGHFLTSCLAYMIFRIIEQKLNRGGARYRDAEILRTLRDYEAVDAESFYVGAIEGKAVRALEGTFELAGSMTAFSKAQFRRLVARSKKEKI